MIVFKIITNLKRVNNHGTHAVTIIVVIGVVIDTKIDLLSTFAT